jgi:hypothetical protein
MPLKTSVASLEENRPSMQKLILCHLTPSPIALMSDDVIVNNRNKIVILHLLREDYIYKGFTNVVVMKCLAFEVNFFLLLKKFGKRDVDNITSSLTL